MDGLGGLYDELLLTDGLGEILEEKPPAPSPDEPVEIASSTIESDSESTDCDETPSSAQREQLVSGRSAASGNAGDKVRKGRRGSYDGEYRVERSSLVSTERERGFLNAIFGSANLHKLWFPIELGQLPSTEDALSNYLIENLLPTELNRFFAPAAWCQLKALVERKRRAWTCRLCSIPRNRNMMECEVCHTWFHMCCVQAVRATTYLSFDSWICAYCIETMKRCTVIVDRLTDV